MLMQNGGYLQPSLYYPEHVYLSHHTTHPPPHFDMDFYPHPSEYPAHHHHHHHHHHTSTSPTHQTYLANDASYPLYHQGSTFTGCACNCPAVPVQETFLHKILTGKGYKNDAVSFEVECSLGYGGHKMERYPGGYNLSSSCCYASLGALPLSAAYPGSIPSIQ